MEQSDRLETLELYQRAIADILQVNAYGKIVLQIPKHLLTISFHLSKRLQGKYSTRSFFVLYDSLKQACCTDVLGAEHVAYDCLIHFGPACFSSDHQPHIHYVFQKLKPSRRQTIEHKLKSNDFKYQIVKNNIGYLIADQPSYSFVKELTKDLKIEIEVLRLPFDKQENDQYLIFGYYISKNHDKSKNILAISEIEDNIEEQQMNFNDKILFSLKSLSQKVGPSLFCLSDSQKTITQQYKVNFNKRIMQRYSLISSLQKFEVFGIIVSNTATSFFVDILERCKLILKKNNKKYFVFMMNNLNEVKLGNFPEIEAYVIISCFNHSLFAKKDFQRILVTSNDLQIAFQNRQFDRYNFDMKSEQIKKPQETITQENKEQNYEMVKVQGKSNTDIVLQNTIQTLSFYNDRLYKGLQFNEKKQIKKISKGKIGLAQEYTKLE